MKEFLNRSVKNTATVFDLDGNLQIVATVISHLFSL
jgi:hypothetical protein